MRQRIVKMIFVIFFGFQLPGLLAQNLLIIKERKGTEIQTSLNTIRKLTFTMGNVTLEKTDGSISTFGLSDIRNLSFGSSTVNIEPIRYLGSIQFKSYPNPVTDQLMISYELTKSEHVQLEIIDLNGKVMFKEINISKGGITNKIIPVSNLPKGLYTCRLQTLEILETIKFLKY